jgi:hypothetical protein
MPPCSQAAGAILAASQRGGIISDAFAPNRGSKPATGDTLPAGSGRITRGGSISTAPVFTFVCGADHRQESRRDAIIHRRLSQGGVLCLTNRRSMSWSACAWPQIALNWQATFAISNWRHISVGWPRYGPPEPNRARTGNSIKKSTSRFPTYANSATVCPSTSLCVILLRCGPRKRLFFRERNLRPLSIDRSTSCVSHWNRSEPQLKVVPGRHRTAPLRPRSIRTMLFPGRGDREL